MGYKYFEIYICTLWLKKIMIPRFAEFEKFLVRFLVNCFRNGNG